MKNNFIKTLAQSLILISFLGCSSSKKNNIESISMKNEKYIVKENLKPSNLSDISDNQINDHWTLYVGYVNQVNKLNEELSELAAKGQLNSLTYSDRRRQYGFEYNGMVLHEYYFGNLKNNVSKNKMAELYKAIQKNWGSFDNWAQDFINTGTTRGIGWAILYADPTTKDLINCFIAEHQIGNITGFMPILVMDVWEHAYMVDHKAGGRVDYINAFLKNVDWSVVEKRYDDLINSKITKRF
ncbi:superoxide dismutase [Candidatus Babeliales bacterium]|nr:superoxide dismutase [Candidatus Babeliales bacterium]MCF7899240.1 superoxide dismutase [Candidatus Babeliales bacterium]